MGWELENAIRFQTDPRDAEGSNVLLDVNDLVGTVEEDQVDWKQHPDGVHAVGWPNPKPTARASPIAGLAQQADQPLPVCVRHRHLGGDEGFSTLIVNIRSAVCLHRSTLFRMRRSLPPLESTKE